MDKIRLGNDIEMRWSIFTRDGDNKVPYNLEGRALTLSVVNRTGESEIEFFAEGNIVTGVFRGRDQRILGKHGVILRENNGENGMRTIDACDAFELVACSCEEALGSSGTIQLFHLTFDSTIGAITGTIDPIVNHEAEQAEAERKTNEIIRKANEQQRIDNEKQRNVNEILRNIAEEERKNAEQERIVNEDLRKADEAERKTNEESRLQSESERVSSEEERLYAESIRVANENARIVSEAKRAEAETARIEAEDKRIVSEKNRLSAESSRIANEDSRRANEDSRLSAEAKRVSAEEERKAKFASMVVQSTGDATDKVMSQKSVTEALKGKQETLTDTDGGYGQRVAELETRKANLQHQHTVADITDFPELYYDATAFFTSGAYPSDKYEELLEAVKAKRTVYATVDETGHISYVFFMSSANSDGSSSRVLLTTIFADGSYLYLNTFVLQQSGMTPLQESITGKANKATTLAGYGIGDAYTKSELDALLKGKQSNLTDTDGGYGQRVAELEKEGIASQEKLTELDLEISESISKINDLVGGEIIKDILSQSEWQNGRVTINSIQNSTLFQYIKFTAAKNDIIHYKGRNSLNYILLACKSVEESAKTIIVNGAGSMTEGDVVAPIDGEYWFCVQSEFKDSSILTISGQATGRVNDIEDEIDLLSSNITDVKKIIGDITIESIDLTDGYISGSYIQKNGTLISFKSGRISKQIPLSKGRQIAFTGRVANVMVAIAVYDNGAYIPKVVGLDDTQYITYKYVADDDCIVVLCSAYDHTNDYAEIVAPISARLDNLDKKTENLIAIDSFGLEETSNNPLERLKEGGFASIVRSWAFIGDSMASGATLGYEQGASSATEKDDYWASWGQFICRMHGSEGFNYSAGGESAKGWCINSKNNGREWEELQKHKHEAYIVALGQNDTYWVTSNDQNTQVRNYPCISAYPNRESFQSEGLVITEDDVRADIDLTDYNNNAETFVGYYAGIIQRIKSTNDMGYIFLMTNPQATAPNQPIHYKYYNDCIRHIYNIFKAIYPDTVWLIEMDKYSHYKDIKTQIALNGLHFGAFGYKWSALEINTYIDWIIRNNISAFQGISMVLDNKKPTSW